MTTQLYLYISLYTCNVFIFVAIPLYKSLYLQSLYLCNGHKRGKKKPPKKDGGLYEYPTEAWTHSILVVSVIPHSGYIRNYLTIIPLSSLSVSSSLLSLPPCTPHKICQVLGAKSPKVPALITAWFGKNFQFFCYFCVWVALNHKLTCSLLVMVL